MAPLYLNAMTTTIEDVRDALDNLSTVNFNEDAFDDAMQVTLSESEAGQFYQAVRVEGLEAQTKRLGDSLVSRIEAEEESEGLGNLFG